jgi:hypothetical protein
MTTEEAVALLELEWPRSNKLSCTQASDSSPSLHLYPEDKGFYCFTCNVGGDGLGLLAHYTGRPIAEILTEHGVSLGPRGRSRWQQVDDELDRVAQATAAFTLEMRALWGARAFTWLAQYGDRVDESYSDIFRVEEDVTPAQLHARVRDLERYYDSVLELHRGFSAFVVTSERERIQGSELRSTVRSDGRPGGGSVRVRLSRQD